MAALFKKKIKKENAQAPVETPQTVMDEGVSETIIEEKDLQGILGDVMKSSGIDEVSEKIDDLTRKLDEIQSRLERHDSLISSLQNEISEMRNVNEEIQDNIKRLLDVYEVVSQNINPFIDMSKGTVNENTVIQDIEPVAQEHKSVEQYRAPEPVIGVEQKETESEKKPTAGRPILTKIRKDYYTIVLLMRWIEFLFERVKRDKITLLLDYYVDIGWISKEVKSEIMAYARGEVQDVTKYFPEEDIEAEIETPAGTIKAPSEPKIYKKVEDWRLSAEDHLKSLLFIMKIAGVEVNKDRLNSLEQEIEKFKKSLWEFHGV